MVTLSVMMMFSLVCLSSCNSSVNPDAKGGKTPDDPSSPKITVTYSCSDNNGTIEAKVISSKEGKIEGNKIINLVSGDKIQFTAKPNNSYKFKEWIPKKLGNKETFELTVDKNLSVSVEFEENDFPFKITKDSPIVYKTSGLGFGKKGNDGKIYYAISDYEEGSWNGLDENDLKDAYKHPPAGSLKAPFDSIHKGLDQRWNYYKSSIPSKFENEGKYFTQLFNDPSYKISLKDNDLEVWAHLKYKFTLDDLFSISLRNKSGVDHTTEISEFNEFKSKIGSDYDVYLIIIDSGLFHYENGKIVTESTDKDFCWCDVLKFGDPFWKEK